MFTTFSSVICSLTVRVNQDTFASARGFELMVSMIRQRKVTYKRAFDIIDAAILNHPSNCEAFVNAGVLKVLHPLTWQKVKLTFTEKR